MNKDEFKVKVREGMEYKTIYEGYAIELKLHDGREIRIAYDNRGDLRISQSNMVIVPVVSNVVIIKEDK